MCSAARRVACGATRGSQRDLVRLHPENEAEDKVLPLPMHRSRGRQDRQQKPVRMGRHGSLGFKHEAMKIEP